MLKWGGIALAIVSAIAIYVQYIAAAPPAEAGAVTDEAPMTLYAGRRGFVQGDCILPKGHARRRSRQGGRTAGQLVISRAR